MMSRIATIFSSFEEEVPYVIDVERPPVSTPDDRRDTDPAPRSAEEIDSTIPDSAPARSSWDVDAVVGAFDKLSPQDGVRRLITLYTTLHSEDAELRAAIEHHRAEDAAKFEVFSRKLDNISENLAIIAEALEISLPSGRPR